MTTKGKSLVQSLQSTQTNYCQKKYYESPNSLPFSMVPAFELEDHNRSMLETFKKNSGLSFKVDYKSSLPKQSQVLDGATKANSYMTQDFLNDQYQKQLINIEDVDELETERVSDRKQFIFQIFITLGLANRSDEGLTTEDLVEKGYLKFIEMKSNGRWQIIEKLFKISGQEQSSVKNNSGRSIIKKKTAENSRVGEKKRVKVIEPETASQLIRTKFRLAEDLQSKMKKLETGFPFKKYCFKSEKIEEVNIYFSSDLKFIAQKKKKKEPKVESMSNFSGITEGARSKNFQKYICKGYQIDQKLGLSILLKERSLDLVAESIDKKQQFMEAVKFARNFL